MNEFLAQFTRRSASPAVQFIKYSIAGGIATAIHIVVFMTSAWKVFPALEAKDALVRLLHLSVPVLSDAVRARHAVFDNVIAFFVSNTCVYLMNIFWVFEPGRHHPVLEVALFFSVSAVSLFVGSLLMGVLIREFHLSTTIAFGANIVASMSINYVMRKFVVFKG